MTAPVKIKESTTIQMTAPVGIKESENIQMTAPVTITETADIDMTAPVTIKESKSIDMTTPVTITKDQQDYTVSFVMPFNYTLQTLPKPNNPQVEIKTQPARKVAALKFSWYAGPKRVEAKKQELLNSLSQDGVATKGTPEYAGYDAPLSAPWLRRNEILIDIE